MTTTDFKSKTILTGIKPTNIPHLGNYLGAIRPGIELCEQSGRSFLFIADYHSLVTVHDPKELREFSYGVAATWIACGLNPEKTAIYRQSDIPEIFELSWVLSCMAPKGLLNRAHAYKARVQDNKEQGKEDLDFGVSMGLFCYPVLMAADILMFDTDIIPVGEDQIQHVEIARDIAQKFNRTFGDALKVPNFHVQMKTLLPGLDGRKMSKSYDNHIPLFMDEKKFRKRVMSIKTDSLPPEAPKDPNTSLVFQIYKEFATVNEIETLRKRYEAGIGWGDAKQALYELLLHKFQKPTEIYSQLMNDKAELEKILKKGAEKAREVSVPVMKRVRNLIK